ncbi:hypothetical protein D3C77_416830 [compost metagenome]
MLGQLQCCGRTRIVAGLHQAQYVLGIGQVEPGNTHLLGQRQALQIAVGDTAEQGQLDRLAVVTAGVQVKQGAVSGSCFATPEVDLVAGTEARAERGAGAFAVAGIELVEAIAVQQVLTAAIQAELDLRQQRRAGDHCRGLGLADPRCCGGEVEAVTLRLRNQLIEWRAGKLLPPVQLGQWLGKRRVALPCLGR